MSFHTLHRVSHLKNRAAICRRLLFEPLERRDMLATITITSLADNLNVDGQITLREAIRAAELDISVDGSVAGNGADVVQFAAALSGDVDLLLAGDTTHGRSAFLISSDIAIRGNTSGVAIQRSELGPEMRLFNVTPTGRLTLESLTLAGGIVRGARGQDPGGNGAAAHGGAIFSEGTIRLIASSMVGNAVHGGDAVGGGTGGEGRGGAIHNLGGDVLILNSTLSGNSAHSGAGGNISSFGGALNSRNGNVEIYNSTITNNVAIAGREVCITAIGGTATVEVYSSIIAQADAPSQFLDFLAAADTDGVLTVIGANNIIRRQNDFQSIAISNEDPKLGPLADSGGPTPTHALLQNSPAIDQGGNPRDLSTDQRGTSHQRVKGGQADIGSFEVQNVNEPDVRGDYNRNGIVDAADYVVWRKTLGSNVAPSTGADDDNDGLVELHEYGIWRNFFGSPSESSQFSIGTVAVQLSAADASVESATFLPTGFQPNGNGDSWSDAKKSIQPAGASLITPSASQTPSPLLAVLADRVFESLASDGFTPLTKFWKSKTSGIESVYSTVQEIDLILSTSAVSDTLELRASN
jgi:hypothetical protein